MKQYRALFFVTPFLLAAFACGDDEPDGASVPDVDAGGADEHDGGKSGDDAGTRVDAAIDDDGTCDVAAGDPEMRIVATDRGLVRGIEDEGAVSFRGIPYAGAPTGPRRWKPPVAPACWTGVRDASAYGKRCAQRKLDGSFTGDEDCLFLNVWTPALPNAGTEATRPVLFFIHGGANIIGSSNENGGTFDVNLYEAAKLAKERDAVVVTLNYRLGPLGFLAHPALSAEGGGHSGNFGTRDQIRALEWVKRNVAAFGGDPSHVLVFGESAGALNTCVMMTSQKARGLFSAALMESGSCAAKPLAAAEQAGTAYAVASGCDASKKDPAACLRDLPASALAPSPTDNLSQFGAGDTTEWNLPWGPIVDGDVLTEAPYVALSTGRAAQVPFAVGTNADETELFIPGVINTCIDYAVAVRASYGKLADVLLDKYPCGNYTFPRWAMVDLTTDATFACPARRITRAAVAGGNPAVFRYLYTHGRAYGTQAALRAYHASELPFLFQTYDVSGYVPTEGEKNLAHAMGAYWSQLAKSGDPGAFEGVTWPRFAAGSEEHLVLDTKRKTSAKCKEALCDFWDTLAPH